VATFTDDWNAGFDGAPVGTDNAANADDDINTTRTAIREIVAQEHDFAVTDVTNQGKHLAGSAKAYYQADAPTLTPGGDALGSEDYGRVWIDSDTGIIYHYKSGGFTASAVSTTAAITVAEESSDTTCYPVFVTAATGSLGPKTGTNLMFDSSTGILTATGFAGALTGDVTGNADTATSATSATNATTADRIEDQGGGHSFRIEAFTDNWDMDTDQYFYLAHGVGDLDKIMSVSASIQTAAGSSKHFLPSLAWGGTVDGAGIYDVGNTVITLTRETGGGYDTATYNNALVVITIWYTV